MPVKRKFTLAAGVVGLAAVMAVTAMLGRHPDYRVLFTNLSDRDGGSVIASLTQMNVPYKFAEGGGAILIPSDKVHDVRLKLASQGLPKGGTVGFELMESQKFGVTQFQERLNFQRGLEGELSRSIQSLAAVQHARVHLALPAQNGFLREQQKPSASVLLTLHPGRTVDRAQVDGIIHLVASSVADLAPKQVSVVDQNGTLLSAVEQATDGMNPTQINYVRQLEAGYIARIVDIVEPILGAGNVRAQVTADVDFTQSESTAEEFRPNLGRDAVPAVRSQQISESSSTDGSREPAQGVPGALTNQPPPQSSAPINGKAQALQTSANNGGPAGSNGANAPRNSQRDSTTNYEVDKTVRVTRNAPGQIRRLTAAVVLNHRKSLDADGKLVATSLTEKEIESITALVREAIGVSKDRGDSVNVMNAAFSGDDAPKGEPVPPWKDPENIALAKDGAKYLGLVLLGLITIFGVIRPALKPPKALPAPGGVPGQLNETVQDDLSLPAPQDPAEIAARATAASTEQMLKIAREDPAAVAHVIRTWIGSNG
ncbi:MAG: flagellar basal-body MS-ring/collar protein FliF [Burkholderiaceae bacterium]